jgi:hypothetical protein
VAIDQPLQGSPFHVYLLQYTTTPDQFALHCATAPSLVTAPFDSSKMVFDSTQILPMATQGTTVQLPGLGLQWPVAMVTGQAAGQNNTLYILDRGIDNPINVVFGIPPASPPNPKIIVVHLDSTGQKFVSKDTHPLTGVVNDGISLCLLSTGDLLVGDAYHLNQTAQPAQPIPADLVKIPKGQSSGDNVSWTGTRLLASLPMVTDDRLRRTPSVRLDSLPNANPLVAPVAILRDDDNHFYVLDSGLAPHNMFDDVAKRSQDPNVNSSPLDPSDDVYNPCLRTFARPAAVYRVDLGPTGQSTPTITQVSEAGRLVRPSSMAMLNGTLYISDQGLTTALLKMGISSASQTLFNDAASFNVNVEFSNPRPSTLARRSRLKAERRQIVDAIAKIVDQEKPIHSIVSTLALATKSTDLFGIWGNAGDLWAVGSSGTILRWNGTAWSTFIGGTSNIADNYDIWGFGGAGSTDIWSAGIAGQLRHWDGTQWSPSPSNTTNDLSALFGIATNDVWAVGDQGTLQHWDGNQWSSRSTPDFATLSFTDAWGNTSNNIWAVGWELGGPLWQGRILNWNGAQWSRQPGVSSSPLNSVWGIGATDVWAVGDNGTIVHGTSAPGGPWTVQASGTTSHLNAIWGSGTDLFAVGDSGTIVHWNGSAWAVQPSGTTHNLNDIWGTSSSDVWATGNGGTILHLSGGQWGPVQSSL